MSVFYGLFAFGLWGNAADSKRCVTNYVNFYPYPYKNPTDLDNYMKHPGALDMTSRFDHLMMFGFVANLVFIVHMMMERRLSDKAQKDYGFSRILLDLVVNVTWMV